MHGKTLLSTTRQVANVFEATTSTLPEPRRKYASTLLHHKKSGKLQPASVSHALDYRCRVKGMKTVFPKSVYVACVYTHDHDDQSPSLQLTALEAPCPDVSHYAPGLIRDIPRPIA